MSDDAPTPATTPTEIGQAGPRTLRIRWADGASHELDVRALRLACGCAHCVDEWTGEDRLDPATVPADVHPRKIDGVGRYAIQIAWSDGHDAGIYPFRRLRELGEQAKNRASPTEDGASLEERRTPREGSRDGS